MGARVCVCVCVLCGVVLLCVCRWGAGGCTFRVESAEAVSRKSPDGWNARWFTVAEWLAAGGNRIISVRLTHTPARSWLSSSGILSVGQHHVDRHIPHTHAHAAVHGKDSSAGSVAVSH